MNCYWDSMCNIETRDRRFTSYYQDNLSVFKFQDVQRRRVKANVHSGLRWTRPHCTRKLGILRRYLITGQSAAARFLMLSANFLCLLDFIMHTTSKISSATQVIGLLEMAKYSPECLQGSYLIIAHQSSHLHFL